MQRESKKHHYVPQSLLKLFSVDGTREWIYVFDKSSGKAFKASIKNVGSQNDFNKLETESGTWNFEHIFSEVDGRLANLLSQIQQARNLSVLTADDRRDWADMVAVQLLRTPIMRTTMTQIAVDLVDALVESGLAKREHFSLPSDNDSRRSMVKTFLDRNSMRTALEDKNFVLFEGAYSNSISYIRSPSCPPKHGALWRLWAKFAWCRCLPPTGSRPCVGDALQKRDGQPKRSSY